MHCPDCDKALSAVPTQVGSYFLCQNCQGRMVNNSVLRKMLGPDKFQSLWNESEHAVGSGSCPECYNAAPDVPCSVQDHIFSVRLCRPCHTSWIEGRFAEQLPEALRQKKTDPLANLKSEDRVAHAEALAGTVAMTHQRAAQQAPDEIWKWPLGALGFAVRFAPSHVTRTPYVCYALTLIAVIFTWWLSDGATEFGFVPSKPLAMGGLTLVTSIFLHGGFLHLLSNFYYLLTFGRELESKIGPLKFGTVFFCAAWAGIALHAILDPRSATPLIGASGGVAGILTFFAFCLPRVRVGIFLWLWPIVFRWFSLPVMFALVLWIAQQLAGSMHQLSGFDSISYLGHLGGAIAGAALFYINRALQPAI